MPRDKTIKILRTTRANLNTQKNANGLIEGEPYLITDENRLAIGTATNNYEDFAKKMEVDTKKTDNVSTSSRILGRKSSGAGVIEELTLSEVMDFIGSAAQGDILYRGASAWARLPKGTDGQVLTLASGLPSWATGGGGGSAGKYCLRTTDFINTSTSTIDVPGMSFTIDGSKKYFLFMTLALSNDDTESGMTGMISMAMSSGSMYRAVMIHRQLGGTMMLSVITINSGDPVVFAVGTSGINTTYRTFLGILLPSSSGTLKLQLTGSVDGGYGTRLISTSQMVLQEVTA